MSTGRHGGKRVSSPPQQADVPSQRSHVDSSRAPPDWRRWPSRWRRPRCPGLVDWGRQRQGQPPPPDISSHPAQTTLTSSSARLACASATASVDSTPTEVTDHPALVRTRRRTDAAVQVDGDAGLSRRCSGRRNQGSERIGSVGSALKERSHRDLPAATGCNLVEMIPATSGGTVMGLSSGWAQRGALRCALPQREGSTSLDDPIGRSRGGPR